MLSKALHISSDTSARPLTPPTPLRLTPNRLPCDTGRVTAYRLVLRGGVLAAVDTCRLRDRRRAMNRIRSKGGSRTLASMWRSFADPAHDLRHRSAAITSPTLVAWGPRDRVAAGSWGRTAQQLILGCNPVDDVGRPCPLCIGSRGVPRYRRAISPEDIRVTV